MHTLGGINPSTSIAAQLMREKSNDTFLNDSYDQVCLFSKTLLVTFLTLKDIILENREDREVEYMTVNHFQLLMEQHQKTQSLLYQVLEGQKLLFQRDLGK